MKYRFMELYGLSAALVANQTIQIELDMVDPVSQIIIDGRVNNGDAGDSTAPPVAFITKAEIVDGSDVLFSLDGYEMQALDIYDSGVHPRGGWYNYIETPTDFQVAINFGRYLWDEELAFDPTKFRNPVLNITVDFDGGGRDPTSVQLSALALLFDEKAISPSGFLMTKEQKSWTKAVGGHEYTDMPLDYAYRKMFLQSRLDSIPPNGIFGNIKLATDQDKKVILNGEYRDLMFGIGRENAFIRETWVIGGDSAQVVSHITPTMDVFSVASAWEDKSLAKDISCYDGDGGHLETICEVAANIQVHAAGWAPHGTLCIPFGKPGVIDDWFELGGIGSLKLDVTSGNASGVQKLFIQQYRTY
ncbi:hypothetical protein ES703_08502 [subsurface metagenome]